MGMVTTTKVLVNCLSSRSGGAVSYLRNIVRPLADELRRHNAQLALLLRADHRENLSLDGVEAIVPAVAGREGWRRHLWETRHIPALVRESGCSVLFTPYQIGVRVPGVPAVGMLRNMEPFFHRRYPYSLGSRLRNEILRVETGRFLRGVDRVIAVSQFAAQQARELLGVASERVTVVYHGRDESFGPTASTGDAALLEAAGVTGRYLFTCGSLLPYRRLEDVIEAYGQAELGAHPASLVVAGRGTDARYAQRIAGAIDASPRKDTIRVLGHVSPALMKALYRQAEWVVLATEVEACPNIAIEALSSGSRIVAADVPVMREILGESATFYPPRDVRTLAQLLGKMGSAGSGPVIDVGRYAWSTCAKLTAEVLLETTHR